MLKFIITPDAQDDIRTAAHWLNTQSENLADVFLSDLDVAFEHILNAPESYGKRVGNIRRRRLDRFKYHLYYSFDGENIRVLAAIHTSRNPRWIKKTLRKRK